jgi:Ca-activated chloride channel family protein
MPAQAQNETVLVLGFANSMWSKMDGGQKIKVLRGGVASILRAQEGKLDLGVMTFGANKPKSCDAIDTIKPIGPIKPQADIKAIDGIYPKGSASVAAALTAASKLFKTQSGAQSMILVSDSMDECKADPCAVAAELKEKSPRTIIHFIALGEKSEEKLAELACVPEQTGGTFAAAQNEAELNDALQKTFQLAALGTSEDPCPPLFPRPLEQSWAHRVRSQPPPTLVRLACPRYSPRTASRSPAASSGASMMGAYMMMAATGFCIRCASRA